MTFPGHTETIREIKSNFITRVYVDLPTSKLATRDAFSLQIYGFKSADRIHKWRNDDLLVASPPCGLTTSYNEKGSLKFVVNRYRVLPIDEIDDRWLGLGHITRLLVLMKDVVVSLLLRHIGASTVHILV